jgi:hypothetical protein
MQYLAKVTKFYRACFKLSPREIVCGPGLKLLQNRPLKENFFLPIPTCKPFHRHNERGPLRAFTFSDRPVFSCPIAAAIKPFSFQIGKSMIGLSKSFFTVSTNSF